MYSIEQFINIDKTLTFYGYIIHFLTTKQKTIILNLLKPLKTNIYKIKKNIIFMYKCTTKDFFGIV